MRNSRWCTVIFALAMFAAVVLAAATKSHAQTANDDLGDSSGEVTCPNGAVVDSVARCKFFFHFDPNDGADDVRVVSRITPEDGPARTIRSVALVVGIESYPRLDDEHKRLDAAGVDADKLSQFLAVTQKFDEVIVLRDDDATEANIHYFLSKYFVTLAGRYSLRVVFAYSGHGRQHSGTLPSALILSQANTFEESDHVYTLVSLHAELGTLAQRSFHVLTLINACYGGDLFGLGNVSNNPYVPTDPGSFAVTAGPDDNVVYAMPLDRPGDHKGSIFFENIVNGISSNDINDQLIVSNQTGLVTRSGIVRLGSLVGYLTDRIDVLNKLGKTDKRYRTDYKKPRMGPVEPPGTTSSLAYGAFFFLSPETTNIAANTTANSVTRRPPPSIVPAAHSERVEAPLPLDKESNSVVLNRPDLLVFNAPDQYKIKGVDASHFDGDIDWPAVKADGYSFAYVKATQGDHFVDQTFTKNWYAAADAGLARGGYHFFSYCASEESQLDLIKSVVPKDDAALPFVLDLERSGGAVSGSPEAACFKSANWQDTALKLLTDLKTYFGKQPTLYTNSSFVQETHILGRGSLDKRFEGFPIWIANFRKNNSALNLGLETPWTIWNHTAQGTVHGFKTMADLSVFFGSDRQWDIYRKGQSNVVLDAVFARNLPPATPALAPVSAP